MYPSSVGYDAWHTASYRDANFSFNYFSSTGNVGDHDVCDDKSGYWKSEFAVTLSSMILSLVSNILYLIMVIFCGSLAHSYFLFLNSFMVANFVNFTVAGSLGLFYTVTHCWNSGELACKAVHGLVNYSENAIAFYIVALILEQCHPRVRAFFLSDDRRRKLIVTIAVLIGTIVFSLPEFISAEVTDYGKITTCGFSFSRSGHYHFFVHQTVIIEYWSPALITFLFLIHAAFQLRRLRNRPAMGEGDSSVVQQTENDDDGDERYPRYPIVTLALGLTFSITRLPFYLCLTMLAMGNYACYIPGKLGNFIFLLHGLFTCLPPPLILFFSPFHKAKVRETWQYCLSCLSGRRVEGGFALRDEEEH